MNEELRRGAGGSGEDQLFRISFYIYGEKKRVGGQHAKMQTQLTLGIGNKGLFFLTLFGPSQIFYNAYVLLFVVFQIFQCIEGSVLVFQL